MARSFPRWRNRLISHGLRVLQDPEPADLPAIARVLVRYADTGDEQRGAIATAIRDALSGPEPARTTAAMLQNLIDVIADETKAKSATRALATVRGRAGSTPPPKPEGSWADFVEELETFPATPETAANLQSAVDAINSLTLGTVEADTVTAATVAILNALADSDAARALATALPHVIADEPALIATLREEVLPVIHRDPVGDHLRHA